MKSCPHFCLPEPNTNGRGNQPYPSSPQLSLIPVQPLFRFSLSQFFFYSSSSLRTLPFLSHSCSQSRIPIESTTPIRPTAPVGSTTLIRSPPLNRFSLFWYTVSLIVGIIVFDAGCSGPRSSPAVHRSGSSTAFTGGVFGHVIVVAVLTVAHNEN